MKEIFLLETEYTFGNVGFVGFFEAADWGLEGA